MAADIDVPTSYSVLSSLVTSGMRFGGCVVEQRGKNINLYHVWYRLIFYTACGIVLLLELILLEFVFEINSFDVLDTITIKQIIL